jgi:hypothetical protein
MFFVEEKEPIQIDNSWAYGCNRCVICNNDFKHSRLWWGVGDSIFELREKIAHPTCVKIVNDIKKKKQELTDLEYKLFEKKYMIDE